MTEIAEFEARIKAALDRIGNGLGQIQSGAVGGTDEGELTQAREALEAEKVANAQLEERVKAIREKQEKLVGRLETEVANLREAAAKANSDIARLQDVNAKLRTNNQALREANETGVGDPHLINKAMMAELESLRASRDADRTELDAIIGELKPMVEGRADA